MRRHWLVLVAILLSCGAPAAPRDPLVLVERLVDARYGDTPQANADLAAGLKSPLRYLYTVKPGDSLQQIAGSLFRVSPTKSQSTYAQIEKAIKESNGLSDVNRITAGKMLLVPDLPPKVTSVEAAVAGGGTAAGGGAVPKITLGPQREDVMAGRAYDFSRGAALVRSEVTNLRQESSPLVRQVVWLPASKAQLDPTVTIIAQPISVKFHTTAAAGGGDDISQDVAKLQQYSVSHHAVHESVVYVLDDAWPDADAFSESIDFLQKADGKVRQYFHLGTASWPTSLSPPRATTTFPAADDGSVSHAAQIQSSLQPFRPISSSVKVVYVPLFMVQKGASDLLGEIILVSLISRYKQSHLEDPMSDTAMKAITTKAISERDQIVASLPAYKADQPADTDQAVITGLLQFAQLYAQATGQPFFLNTSWVVDQYEFEFGPPPNLLGVTLAAVGDSPAIDIFKSNVLLASRAKASPGDVVAIMNNHPDGTRGGCTSYWTDTAPAPIYGLTYDGFLDGNVCGTSFSAPRVAWTLAFRESLRPTVTEPQAQSFWFQNYKTFILSLQNSAQANDLRYWFSPGSVVQKP